MHEFFRRLQYMLNRRRREAELADEMEFHREMASRSGNTGFGNTLRLREESRDAWGWTWIDDLMHDLRYGARVLRKSPGFTTAAVMMLAIGIGVNVAAFGFFSLVLLRPLPVRDPDTLVRLQRSSERAYATDVPYPAMEFYREHARSLSAVIAVSRGRLTLEKQEKPAFAHFVTANYFTELGAAAHAGRMLDPTRDDAPGAEPVVVLGYEFWQRAFGSDASILGRTIQLNRKPVTVIGVASLRFSGLMMQAPDVWVPVTKHPYFITGSKLLTDYSDGIDMWGRLQPGQTPQAAEAELQALAAELRRQHPKDIWENERLTSSPGGYAGKTNTSRGSSPPKTLRQELVPVVGMVGALVLLILTVACANLGSLLLARSVAREREIGIRAAVGAGSGRLVRQLFTESVLLALIGSAAGLVLGYAVLRAMMALTGAPVWLDATPDWRVVVFAVVAGFVAAVAFGLAPALQVARQRHRATFMRQLLVGAQVAASCVLLIVAGLLVRALNHAISANPGFEYKQVVTIDPRLNLHGYTPDTARAYMDTLRSRLRAIPGVESVAMTDAPPLGNRQVVSSFDFNGQTFNAHIYRIDPEFFETMRVPLLRGRTLSAGDRNMIVVNSTVARRRWPSEDAIGKELGWGSDTGRVTVVGVSGDARLVALSDPDALEIYQPLLPADLPGAVVLVKTSGAPEALLGNLVSTAKGIDPEVLPEVQMMKRSFARKLENTERSVLAVGVLGLVAMLLACLGIVGTVAYAVSRRVKEIGIRMALGAQPLDVLRVVLMQFSRPVIVGLVVGAVGAGVLSQLLRKELYGMSHLDPLSYVAAIGIFAITVAIAALLPARRALRIDPMRALRYE